MHACIEPVLKESASLGAARARAAGEWRIHLEDRATRLSAPPLRWRAPSFPRRTAPPRTVLAPPAAHRWGPGPEAAALDWYRSACPYLKAARAEACRGVRACGRRGD
eukprot:3932132-Rhodomonas_salina.1